MAESQHTNAAPQATSERVEAKREEAPQEAATLLRQTASIFQGGRIDPNRLTPKSILALQRAVGNSAVNRLLRQHADAVPAPIQQKTAGNTVVQRVTGIDDMVLAAPLVSVEILQSIPATMYSLPATGAGFTAGAFQAGSAAAATAETAGAAEGMIAVTEGAAAVEWITAAVEAIAAVASMVTPVGWMVIGGIVVVVAVDRASKHHLFHTSHQVEPAAGKQPAQLPGTQSTPPVADPNTPGPMSMPSDQNYSPMKEPGPPDGPALLPGHQNSASLKAEQTASNPHATSNSSRPASTRKLWKISKQYVDRSFVSGNQAYLHDTRTRLWWSRDTAGHAEVAWKVYDQRGRKLIWRADADEYGDFISDKHKSPIGTVIEIP